jgi:hypothetical protein
VRPRPENAPRLILPRPTRREILTRSALGLGALGLAGLLGDCGELAAQAADADAEAGPTAPKRPHFPGKARRVVHFFLNGGPSHVDTFDPKPALARYEGKLLPNPRRTERKTGAAFPSPFKFRKYGESGLEVSELFAETARHVDDMALIRSMRVAVPNHEPSLMLMNCGDSAQPRPSAGAWVLYGLGTENQNLPGFVVLCPGGHPIKGAENWQSAFLPGAFQGTHVDSKLESVARLIENIEHRHATASAQRRQLDLLASLDADSHQGRPDARLEARIQSFELAFRMQTEAAEAFDASREPESVRELYGPSVHGRQTLIARRLLERGVRYVQLWHGAGQPWDSHANIEREHRKLAAELDRPIAALLTDLKRLGMFDDTLVLWGGEFGRTPTVELGGDGKAKLGRDHNPYGFTVWMAGGGVKGGTVHGATDEFGFEAAEDPASVHDLHATILHLLGFDHEKLTYRYAGRDFRLTDVHGSVLTDILA